MQIKHQISKLTLRVPLPQLVQEQTSQNHIMLMPLNDTHIYGLSQLSDHHRDPFDRLIISQAMNENLTLITNDHHIQKYAVTTLW